MPIILDANLQQAYNDSATKIQDLASPKYFSSILTGNSQNNRGLLTESLNPVNIKTDLSRYMSSMSRKKQKITTKNSTTEIIPFEILREAGPLVTTGIYFNKKTENLSDAFIKMGNYEFRISMRPSCIYHDTVEDKDVKVKTTVIEYIIYLWVLNTVNGIPNEDYIKPIGYIPKKREITVYTARTCNPREALESIIENYVGSSMQIKEDVIWEYFDKFNLHDEIARQAERWQKELAKHLNSVIEYAPTSQEDVRADNIKAHLRNMDQYKIDLVQYIEIQNQIEKRFSESVAKKICKVNLQLLLANTLETIKSKKDTIQRFKNDPSVVVDSKYSAEQRVAITCEEPLIITQATAGSGKSTTLNARIEHMIKCGVPAKDITVLSFSNAAADHMKELNQEITSQTIASMVHSIYEMNYSHSLSNLDTINNLIDIMCDPVNDKTTKKFKTIVEELAYQKVGAFAAMNVFIEENFDDVIKILDTIGQTSLELEIIITYQNLYNLKEPDEVICKHLIIDEVQDNSVFEFIFTLKYLSKHECSLFIVGRSNG